MFGIDKNDHQIRFQAAKAQLGERQTEDLKFPGSIRVAAYASTLSSVVLEKAIHDRPRKSRKISTVPNRRRLCYDGRVVKAFDLKSKGIFPRRFESYS